MRRTKSSTSSNSEKLYINSNSLSVCGEKLKISCQSKRVIGSKKQHRIEIEGSVSAKSEEEVEEQKNKKQTIELKKCVPLCEDVVTRQVRKIRETVQVDDFERLLIGLTGATGCTRKGSSALEALGQVYEEFFGAYYEVLHEVVKNRKMSSIT